MVLFLFLLIFNLKHVATDDMLPIPKILHNSTITVSLENYDYTNPDGDSIEFLYSLPPNSIINVTLTNISSDVHFTVLQAHSYLLNITLAYDTIPITSNSITGTDVGLVKFYHGEDLNFYLIQDSSTDYLDVMIAVQAYKKNAPVPGGCNMEFPVEISPFLLTTYNDAVTKVDFAPSSPPLSVFSFNDLHLDSECNIKPSPVKYEMYHRYFPERDFSKQTYFNIIKSMMTKGRILKDAVSVSEKPEGPPTRRFFASYPGTGNAFVVLAHFQNETVAYVPSFTYACNDLKENNTCIVLTTTFSQVLCGVTLFLGLFACFVGHNFFRTEIFLFGFFISGVISYILVSILFPNTNVLTTSVCVGLFIATVMLLSWTFFGLPLISVILTTLTFGFLLASVIFYPLTDHVDSLILDINFWGIFIGILVSCPVLMLCLAEKANILSCAFLGSYVAIISIDYYIGSNLRYIIINTIRRAVADNFRLAVISPPFQLRDLSLSITWIILMFLGIKLQRRLMRNKPPYPPPLPPWCFLFTKLPELWKARTDVNERTPLWEDSAPHPVSFYSSENPKWINRSSPPRNTYNRI